MNTITPVTCFISYLYFMTALTQEQLKKWYNDNIAYLDKPRKIVMTEEDYEFERERLDYDRCVSYFERDRDDYIRQ